MASSSGNIPPNMDPNDLDDDDDLLDLETLNVLGGVNENVPIERMPQHNAPFTGHMYTQFLLNGHPSNMRELLRVDVHCFRALVDELISRGVVDVGIMRMSVEESLAIFLFIVGQSGGHRLAADRFQHSTETINRHFKMIMRGLGNLAPFIITPLDMSVTPPQILLDNRFNPWFEVNECYQS